MKPQDPNIIEVVYHERNSYRSGRGKDTHFLQREARAKTSNTFLERYKFYVVTLIPNGFKVKVPSLDDKRLVKADKSDHIMVTDVAPGFYEIIEQTEDFIIATKIQASCI